MTLVWTSPFYWVRGLILQPNFQKGGGGWTITQFIEAIACKEGSDFFKGYSFYIKNKLKYEIFNDEKGL